MLKDGSAQLPQESYLNGVTLDVALPHSLKKPNLPTPQAEEHQWIFESLPQTPYSDYAVLAPIQERFPRLPKALKDLFAPALLDCLTNSDLEAGRLGLHELNQAMGWSLRFKKAASLATRDGFEGLLKQARADQKRTSEADETPRLDRLLKSSELVFSSALNQPQVREAEHLLEQFEAGNERPGIGTKAIERGVSYLRGRKGTRIFFKVGPDGPRWLAICNKKTEQKAINAVKDSL